jgi:prevent-host-death family protein
MKTVPIESLRRHLGQVLKSEEPVLITRYGKPAGVFYPVPDARKLAAGLESVPKPRSTRSRRAPDPQLSLLKGE